MTTKELEDTFEIMEKMETIPVVWKLSDGGVVVEDYTGYTMLYNPKNNSIEIYAYEFINSFDMKEYKKTWWLKGDMENDTNI